MGIKAPQLPVKLRLFALYGFFFGMALGLLMILFFKTLQLSVLNSFPCSLILGVFYIYQFGCLGFFLGMNTGAHLNRRYYVYKKSPLKK